MLKKHISSFRIAQEYVGKSKPQYVVRLRGEYVTCFPTKAEASAFVRKADTDKRLASHVLKPLKTLKNPASTNQRAKHLATAGSEFTVSFDRKSGLYVICKRGTNTPIVAFPTEAKAVAYLQKNMLSSSQRATTAKRIVSARKTLKNPDASYNDDVIATEFATLLHSMPQGKMLREHFAKTAKKADFSRAKYIAFIAKQHIPLAAIEYYRGNVAEAKRYSNAGINKLAGKYFVEAIEEGNYD